MQSTFSGVELAKRALQANSLTLQTIGHNLSNAATPGYSRQRVEMVPTDPLYRPQLNRAMTPGQVGQGVDLQRIERVKDMLLEGRIVQNSSDLGYWDARSKYIDQLERIFNEPTDSSIRSSLDAFFNTWQELSVFPEAMASRQAVIEAGQTLADGIRNRYQQLSAVQNVVDTEIRVTVNRVNDLTSRIAELNLEIVKVKAEGDQPNDLLDRRDLLVQELGELIPITASEKDPDEFSIYTAGLHIVQGGFRRTFEMAKDPEVIGFDRVQWSDNGQEYRPDFGKLGSFLQLRDKDIREEIQSLDTMAVNFFDLVNEVHREGYGLTGEKGVDFFVQQPFVTDVNGNYDRDGDGAFDSSYIFRLSGTNALNLQDHVGFDGMLTLPGPDGDVQVPYRSTDTVQDILIRVNNSGSEVVFRLDYHNRLTIKATPADNAANPDHVLRSFSDTGFFLAGYSGILAGSGAENGYNWETADAVAGLAAGASWAVAPETHPSGWVQINTALVENPGKIATSFTSSGKAGEVGDGRIALEIADIRHKPVMIGQISTFDDYFADSVVAIGVKGQQAEIGLNTSELILGNLKTLRDNISGVNIDEELANMIKYQQGYNAAARFLTTWNELIDTVINRLGV